MVLSDNTMCRIEEAQNPTPLANVKKLLSIHHVSESNVNGLIFNMFQYLIQAVLELCILSFILFSERSYGAAYQYEACVPKDCGNGLNISYPFYIPGLQESYCGYPGFALNCSTLGFPVLHLPQNDYVVANISYQNRVFRVYDAAMLGFNDSVCTPSVRNTTLPTPQFGFVNVTRQHLFPNCSTQLTENLWPYRIICNRTDLDYRDLSIDDTDSNLRSAVENCENHIVVPMDAGNKTIYNLYDRLRWGFWLNWNASDCNPCQESGGRCGFNETTYGFNCFCPDKPHSMSCPDGIINFDNPIGVSPTEAPPPLPSTKGKSRKTLILAIGVSVAVLMVTAISGILFILFAKKLLKWPMVSKAKTENQMDIKLFLKNQGNLAPKCYRYSEMKKITKSFSDNLGKGGYGSVYKGKLLDGRLVAVKILHESKGNGEEFMNEVASISRTSHVNIVTLLGFCFEGSKRALVYEFLPNGSLEKYIPNTASSTAGLLGWEKLFDIVVGIARGLEYLHQGCNMRILHFDIKPHNILLDKDLRPKISDFGLAKLCPNRSSIVSMPGARGTAGYIAPEVFCRNFGQVSHKSDVYSYGMMVLELVLGRKNIEPQSDPSSEMYFTDWIYKSLEQNVETSHVDSCILVEGDELELAKKKLIIIGLWCIQTEPKNRPSISRVIEMLEGKVESLQVPPPPHLSSSPRLIASCLDSDSI